MLVKKKKANDVDGFNVGCGCRFLIYFNNKEPGIKKKVMGIKARCSAIHRIFGCGLGSELTKWQWDRKERGYYKRMKYEAMMGALWDKAVRIPRNLTRIWNIKYPEVLESACRYTGEKPFKFSYHPKSDEFLFSTPGTPHNLMILNYGHHPFEEYVRGIYFREKKVIYLRMHEDISLLRETVKVLRWNVVGKDIRIIWGEEAAWELREELRGL